MYPIEYDGVGILVVDDDLTSTDVHVLAEGYGRFDGESFEIVCDDGAVFVFPESR